MVCLFASASVALCVCVLVYVWCYECQCFYGDFHCHSLYLLHTGRPVLAKAKCLSFCLTFFLSSSLSLSTWRLFVLLSFPLHSGRGERVQLVGPFYCLNPAPLLPTMSTGYYDEIGDPLPPDQPTFRPFTRQSLAAINARISEKKSKNVDEQQVSHLIYISTVTCF